MHPVTKRLRQIVEELLSEEETFSQFEDPFDLLLVAVIAELTPAKIRKLRTGMSLTSQQAEVIRRRANARLEGWDPRRAPMGR